MEDSVVVAAASWICAAIISVAIILVTKRLDFWIFFTIVSLVGVAFVVSFGLPPSRRPPKIEAQVSEITKQVNELNRKVDEIKKLLEE